MKLLRKIFFFLLLLPLFSYSQELTGNVFDLNKNPISMASLVFLNAENKIINYTKTDESGYFSLKIDIKKIKFIEVSCISFKSITIEYDGDKKLEIQLEDEIFNLKEVEIVAKILKDTVDVKISDNLIEQSTLKDILEKNNDLQISENGTIFYEGKPINKILINKKEVFVNQNNLALNNITKEMIDKVQIVNNYKDKFSFNFEGERNSVINVNTKDSFKGILKNNAEASGGYLNKYSTKLKSMFFSDKLNLFFTNNTNNVLDRDFKFENNNAEIQNVSSTFYKNTVDEIISGNRSVTSSLLSSSSLTLRKETEKSKYSFIFYQNHLMNLFETKIDIFNIENNISNQNNSIKLKANLYLFNFQLNRLINPKNILTYDINVGTSNRNQVNNMVTYVNSSNSLFNVKEFQSIKTLNMINTLTLKSKFNDKTMGVFEFNLYTENSLNDLNSENTENLTNVFQDVDLKSSKIKSNYLIDYNLNNKYLNFGLETSYNFETVLSNDYNFDVNEITFSAPISFRGEYKKNTYFFKIKPTALSSEVSDNKQNQFVLPISFSTFYKMNRKKSINIFFERNFKRNNILQTNPEYFNSIFSKTISNILFNNEIMTNNNFGTQYTYYNFSKSHYFSLAYNGSLNFNNINQVFSTIEDNVLVYLARLADRQMVASVNATYSKGWYFAETLNKITFSPRFEYVNVNNKIAENLIFVNNSFIQKYIISFEPNKSFFKEFNLSFSNNSSDFIENNLKTNRLITQRYNLSILAESTKINLKSNIFYDNYNLGNSTFNRKDININISYKLNDKTNLVLNGNSLLTLFRLDNEVSNINSSNSQGVTTIITNPNILAYLLIGFNIKF